MKSKTLTIVLLSIIIISCFMVSYHNIGKAAGNEIFVDDSPYLNRDGSAEHPWRTIQEAINLAEDGDTIYVFGGDYNETLLINKKLTIIGSIDDGNSILERGTAHKYAVQITADYAVLEGFNISDEANNIYTENGALVRVAADNVIIQRNNFTECQKWAILLDSAGGNTIGSNIINYTAGVYLLSSNNNVISNNIVDNCTAAGVKLYTSSDNIIYSNILENNTYGIYARSCSRNNYSNNTIKTNDHHGIGLYQSNNDIVRNNSISDSMNDGIHLNSYQSEVIGNKCKGNQIGLYVDQSNSEIYRNHFNTSVSLGVYTFYGSNNNKFVANHFNGNAINAREEGDNQWDNGTAGNYWDDYNEIDKDLDGIGDTAYSITSGSVDRYPLGYFKKPPNRPSNPNPADDAEDTKLRITLEVTVSDPDGDMMDVFFYNALDETLIQHGYDYNVANGEKASCTFTLAFDTTFAWYAVADDGQLTNRSDIWFFTTKGRPPENEKPVANAGGPYTAGIDEMVTFDGSGSHDPDGDIEFYRWNFGDGSSEILALSPKHSYSTAGTYNVTLTVIDDNGTSANHITSVTISSTPSNQIPICNCGGPYTGEIDQAITFNGVNSSDADGNIVNYTWDFGDETTGYEILSTHTYSTVGSYVVKLTIMDDDGAINLCSTTVTVSEPESTPGFELLLFFCAIVVLLFIWRKKVR